MNDFFTVLDVYKSQSIGKVVGLWLFRGRPMPIILMWTLFLSIPIILAIPLVLELSIEYKILATMIAGIVGYCVYLISKIEYKKTFDHLITSDYSEKIIDRFILLHEGTRYLMFKNEMSRLNLDGKLDGALKVIETGLDTEKWDKKPISYFQIWIASGLMALFINLIKDQSGEVIGYAFLMITFMLYIIWLYRISFRSERDKMQELRRFCKWVMEK